MQVLQPDLDTHSINDESGHYIDTFLISTRPNEALWKIRKETADKNVKSFIGKHFAIIPELIHQKGPYGGGHIHGDWNTILNGYVKHSHGTITKVNGPLPYNDGTDDFYYRATVKLADSRAASALQTEGLKTWINFAVSPHILVSKGSDEEGWEEWEGAGLTLVIKGAYGPEAVISKLCNGNESSCDKALSKSASVCKNEDAELAQIISSLVSKSASSQISMAENITNEVTNAPPKTETPKIETQVFTTATQAQKVITPEQFEETEKRNKELEKQVTQLVNEAKINTLNTMFAKIKDEKVKKELLEEFSKLEKKDVDLINEKLTKLYPILKASEEEPKPEEKAEEEKKEGSNKKSKSASIELPKEPEVSNESESKTASAPVNKAVELAKWFKNGGRA